MSAPTQAHRTEIVDTTFRDGQQSPLLFDTEKYRFTLEEKKVLMTCLLELVSPTSSLFHRWWGWPRRGMCES